MSDSEPIHDPAARSDAGEARDLRDPPALCVFCGAKSGNDPRWVVAAHEFGVELARRGWRLVYGGGHVGLMGALADGALSAGGDVVGVIPHTLVERELAHPGVRRMEVVPDMGIRKQRMLALSDAFVALPGGLGTLDELFEVLTLRQIGVHDKPVAMFDQHGYWQPMVDACRHMVTNGFVRGEDFESLVVADSISGVFEALERALEASDAGREFGAD